jgi:hypothetical protein
VSVSAASPVRAIIGPGRSGTTWAGTIVDSSPDVIYRFEPFHRMAAVDPDFRDWFEKLKRQAVESADVPKLYELLRIADPLVNKAPFFLRKSYRQVALGRSALWPLARVLAPVNRVYRRAYTPASGPPIVFKEVTFVKPLRNILERTSIPVVYLARNPCATVLSELKGQTQRRQPARHLRLRELLLEYSPSMVDQFPEVIAGNDVVSRMALLWRCEVETCASLIDRCQRGHLMTYEQLAGDAYVESGKLLAHLGLRFTDETRQYLDSLHGVRSDSMRGPRRTGWGNKNFSVYRNPSVEKDAWKSRITSEMQRKIEAVVSGGVFVERLAALGGWW